MNKKIYITLFIATVITMAGLGIIDPILPLYAKSLKATGIQLGIIFAGFALSRSIFAPIVGQYSDRHGRKNLMINGLVLFTVVSACFVYANSPLALTLIRLVQGFAVVLVTPVAQAYIGDLTPVGKEGKYMNLFFMSFFAGMAIGPYLGGYLTDQFNMKVPFYAMGGMSFMVMVLVLFLVPESSAVKSQDTKQVPFFKSLLPVFQDKPMIGIMIYMATRGFYRWGFNTFFPLLAIKAEKMSPANIGLVLSVYMLFGSIMQYPFGLIADKFPSQKVNLILTGGSCSALSMCAVAYSHSMSMFVILAISMGAFSSVSRASALAIRTERGRIYGMGSVTGAFTTSLSVGQVLGPILFGVIADISSIPMAFLVGGLVGLTGTIASCFFFKSGTDRFS
ncbi:MAG: MFS transporter [Desulfobacterales bacterium]|jgi:DHA1 family multidrug resistance protein-like MFS transporter|nr:MFS transporter [Desulfobacterales bacterium]